MNYNKKDQVEIVKKSHERSAKYGIEKNRIFPKKILNFEEANHTLENNQRLLNNATPFIKILYDFLEGSGFFIVLTDKEGCILNVIGDKDVVEMALNLNMVVGAYMSENSIGTNAMGIALKDDIPIQISQSEHFVTAYHRWTCSAAPIHDIDGSIIGSLNLTGTNDKVHPHTLGLVVASVKSIENQINVENAKEELRETYQYMNTIIDSMSLGIYAIDKDGILKTINKEACSVLGIKEKEIVNKNVDVILPDWRNIFERLKNGKGYDNREIVLNNGLIKGRYNASATPILIHKEIIGMVIAFKEMQKVSNLVNKYSGKRAVYSFSDIVGESKEIKKVISYAKAISASPSTVLIEGESGTGKELLAQAIHNNSDRRNNTFIAINCGAIPKSLIESELFGYEEGSFTGARKGGYLGKFELANGGTLFLDEIGEMPLDMQVNLLRVLQEGYVTRVGGDKVIPVDVRIIAATNKNLKEEALKGSFREDLYYRLSVIPIKIPPLRERKEDIPILIRYFFRTKAKKLNKNLNSMNADLYIKMMNYDWPGNIRELENCIENVVNLNGESTMFFDNNVIDNSNNKALNSQIVNMDTGISYTLEELEGLAIINAIEKSEHNMTKAAKLLGITRATLYSKMKKYNIS